MRILHPSLGPIDMLATIVLDSIIVFGTEKRENNMHPVTSSCKPSSPKVTGTGSAFCLVTLSYYGTFHTTSVRLILYIVQQKFHQLEEKHEKKSQNLATRETVLFVGMEIST